MPANLITVFTWESEERALLLVQGQFWRDTNVRPSFQAKAEKLPDLKTQDQVCVLSFLSNCTVT